MIICKDLNIENKITSLEEWFAKCPPQGKEKHWVDGRSAKETAKHWLHIIPCPFIDLLKPLNLKFNICSPEYVTRFDSYKGNGRNHDLLILAENELNENVVISIESKVDESFDNTIAGRIKDAEAEVNKNPNSKALNRIEELRLALFGSVNDDQLNIRYQLLAAIAGTIAEAKKQNAKKAIFLVQTFISDAIDKKKHMQNQKDLNDFVDLISKSKYKEIKDGELLEKISIIGNNALIPCNFDLWIGKYSIEIL